MSPLSADTGAQSVVSDAPSDNIGAARNRAAQPAHGSGIFPDTTANMTQSLEDHTQDRNPVPAPVGFPSSADQEVIPSLFHGNSDSNNGTVALGDRLLIEQMHDSDALDPFWIDNMADSNFLPAVFFDTQYSLADITQRPDVFGLTAQDFAGNSNQGLAFDTRPLHEDAQNRDDVGVVPNPDISATNDELPNLLRGGLDSSADADARAAWFVTAHMHTQISDNLTALAHVLPPGFPLPPRRTLSRYLEGYYRGFHGHLPFLHLTTMTPNALAPELLLSLAAVGAMYRFEHPKGYQLYFAAKALVKHQTDSRDSKSISSLLENSPRYASFASYADARADTNNTSHTNHDTNFIGIEQRARLQTTQALIVLIALASWGDKPVVADALSMSSQLATFVRATGSSKPDKHPGDLDWETWIHLEERRRTLYTAFVFLGLQSIAFEVPPLLTVSDLNLYLPSCSDAWKARNQTAWRKCHASATFERRSFQSTLTQLMTGNQIHKPDSISAFGNYALIHGILQHIFYERQISRHLVGPTPNLRPEAIKSIEAALQLWQASWSATSESSVDPLSSKGPMAFNSTALLRLAYMRLNADLGPHCKLDSRDARCIALAFTECKDPIFTRSANVERAVLQCIHALSIPVQAGVAFVARTQSTNWSVMHSLSTLECALLLYRWLETLAGVVESAGISSLTEDERRLLMLLTSLLQETDYSSGLKAPENDGVRVRRLAAIAIRVWAETLRGFHIFHIVYTIGEALSLVAGILEERILGAVPLD